MPGMLLPLVLVGLFLTLADARALPDLTQSDRKASLIAKPPACAGCGTSEPPVTEGRPASREDSYPSVVISHLDNIVLNVRDERATFKGDNFRPTRTKIGGRLPAVLIVTVVFGGIIAILRSRTFVLRILAVFYVTALCAISLTMRELSLPPLSYRYPGWVTVIHYLSTWTVTAIYWCVQGEPAKLLPSSTGSLKRYFIRMGPIAFALPLAIAMNNTALEYIGAGLAVIIATLSPVVTALVSRIFGRRLAALSWLGVGLALAGALFAGLMELETVLHKGSQGSARDNMTGAIFALLSMLLRSLRVVIQDMVMSPIAYAAKADQAQTDVALTGMHLMAAQSPPVILVAVAYAMATEGVTAAWLHLTPPVVEMLIATSAIAIMVNIWGVTILKDLGSTSMQIIAKLNGIVTTAVSMAFFGESLPVSVLIGSLGILCGVAVFEMGEMTARATADPRADLKSLPAANKS